MSPEDEALLERFKIPVSIMVKMGRKQHQAFNDLVWKLKAQDFKYIKGRLLLEALADVVAKYERGEGGMK